MKYVIWRYDTDVKKWCCCNCLTSRKECKDWIASLKGKNAKFKYKIEKVSE